MKCVYCSQNMVLPVKIYGEPMTVPEVGLAHENCFLKDLHERRVFKNLELKSLSELELSDLKEMVITELNSRDSGILNSIELF